MKDKEALEWCEMFTNNLVTADVDTKRRTLGLQAMERCKNALEKQIPKHYELWNNQCSCPTCNKLFGSYDQLKTLIHWEMPYCKFCGQALIWKD
jgi:hypothetical protein